MSSLLPDFPPGPLDYYRKKASFDWKKMKIFIEIEDVKYVNEVCEILQTHPEFQIDESSPCLDDQRRTTWRQMMAFTEMDLVRKSKNSRTFGAVMRKTIHLCSSSFVKYGINKQYFIDILENLGTERHHKLLEQAKNNMINGCFCLTEIGHGSNTNGMITTATYDKASEEFIMDTPDFEAAKCWAGGLGTTATHAIVFAQLVLDGILYGLHTFVVPIRDPKTLLPYPSLLVGDMGEKFGLHGIDNGFLIFNKYRIPRKNLLNRFVDVTSSGDYRTSFTNIQEVMQINFAVLSKGRVNITCLAECYGMRAVTIAVRYAAVRRQFGPEGDSELPILEYQSHQYRLLPYLAAIYVIRLFSTYLLDVIDKFEQEQDKTSLFALVTEIHVLSSASKSVAGWLFRDAIQECRESCGELGVLKVAGLGDIRNNNDSNCTYEGDNHVIIQQTSNFLIKLWSKIEKGRKIETPLQSTNFLSDALGILKNHFKANNVDEICQPESIMDAYQWLICYLLKETKTKIDTLSQKQGKFWAKSNSQVFFAKSLSVAFIQHVFLQRMLIVINEATDVDIKNVLLKLFSLYGLWSLEKFLTTLYEGGYLKGPQGSRLIHQAILKLCSDIKNDSVSLVDAVAPPDFFLNSVLGGSDGQVYKRLESTFMSVPFGMTRPSWWQEIVQTSTIKNKM